MKTIEISVKCLILLLIQILIPGCQKDDNDPLPPVPPKDTTIIITSIQGVPDHITIDRIKAEIQGKDWDVVTTVEGVYDGHTASLKLPVVSESLLIRAQRRGQDYSSGYWPATCSDTLVGVASLGDFIAYNGKEQVGRVYLSDWSGKGSTAGKAFVYYHYAEHAFDLSGSNKSFTYGASFHTGWNVYANIRSSDENTREHCTTEIQEELDLQWRFEAW